MDHGEGDLEDVSGPPPRTRQRAAGGAPDREARLAVGHRRSGTAVARPTMSGVAGGRGDAAHDRRGGSGVTRGMRVALFVGGAAFTCGTLVQLVLIAWLAVGAGMIALSATALAHTGGLDAATFRTSSIVAIVLASLLLIGIVLTWVARLELVKREVDQLVREAEARASTPSAVPSPDGFYARHPVAATSIGLLLALGATVAAAAQHSPYFPSPLATIVLLASLYFFAVLTVIGTGLVLGAMWSPLKSWALGSPYRTGALTATLILLGAGGFAAREARWYRGPVRDLATSVSPAALPDDFDSLGDQLDVLCVAANETTPALALDSRVAPGCSFLARLDSDGAASDGADAAGGGGGRGEATDCFIELRPLIPKAEAIARRDFGLNAFDANDAAMHALLATCTANPPPTKLASYFFAVIYHHGGKVTRQARRLVSCDDDHDRPQDVALQCSIAAADGTYRVLAKEIWETAVCHLGAADVRIIERRIFEQLEYAEIGRRMGVTPDRARYSYRNALTRLRKLLPASCVDRFLLQ